MIAYRKILVVCFALFLSSCAATPILTGKGDMSREIKQKAPVVFKVDISPDGRYVLSGSLDSFILWDILQGKKIQTFTHKGFMDFPIVVAFSPDGKYFASGGKGAKLWDLATKQEIMTFDDNNAASIAFSPDSKYVLCAGPGPWDLFSNPKPTMKIFDVSTGGEIIDFKIEPNRNNSRAAYSPDGKYVLSAGRGGKVYLWDISLGKPVKTGVGSEGGRSPYVRAVVFSPDGKYCKDRYGVDFVEKINKLRRNLCWV